MDLISREAVVDTIYKRDERLQKCEIYRNKGDRIDLLGVLSEIHVIPPAFHGMTNGEVIQALFPNADYCGGAQFMHITNVNSIGEVSFPWDWWNTPYEKDSK